jgi:hypothetical protein
VLVGLVVLVADCESGLVEVAEKAIGSLSSVELNYLWVVRLALHSR